MVIITLVVADTNPGSQHGINLFIYSPLLLWLRTERLHKHFKWHFREVQEFKCLTVSTSLKIKDEEG